MAIKKNGTTRNTLRSKLYKHDTDVSMLKRAEVMLPPPPATPDVPKTCVDLEISELYGEIDGVERVLGLVEDKLKRRSDSAFMLRSQLDYEGEGDAPATPECIKLLGRLLKREADVRMLKSIRKSCKHFIRQTLRAISDLESTYYV